MSSRGDLSSDHPLGCGSQLARFRRPCCALYICMCVRSVRLRVVLFVQFCSYSSRSMSSKGTRNLTSETSRAALCPSGVACRQVTPSVVARNSLVSCRPCCAPYIIFSCMSHSSASPAAFTKSCYLCLTLLQALLRFRKCAYN